MVGLNPRSAWESGVRLYALDIAEHLYNYLKECDTLPQNGAEVERVLLNGAKDWKQYSWGGSALCYDGDIANRLCSSSELKKTENGAKKPNPSEEWLDTQARALYQAAILVKTAYRNALNGFHNCK